MTHNDYFECISFKSTKGENESNSLRSSGAENSRDAAKSNFQIWNFSKFKTKKSIKSHVID